MSELLKAGDMNMISSKAPKKQKKTVPLVTLLEGMRLVEAWHIREIAEMLTTQTQTQETTQKETCEWCHGPLTEERLRTLERKGQLATRETGGDNGRL